ncbi:MAG: ATP-binding protein [Candidatus Marinimicrobia bacterium]|nr:ATP-binding protein [Candidatus Neomarinimicrobiota bacterium]
MKRALLSDLNHWKNTKNRKPLILRGARQVGKTYLLKAFGKESFSKTYYFNFEKDDVLKTIFEKDLNPIRILSELEIYTGNQINIKTDLLIFDEIQECPKALTSLKYFYEEITELAIMSAGSLLGVVMNSQPFPVGKITFLDLDPLTFHEFLWAIAPKPIVELFNTQSLTQNISDIGHESLWNHWKDYMIVGGLPESVTIFRDNQKNKFNAYQKVREFQNEIIDAYSADIAKHSGKVNAMHIDRVWKNVPTQLSNSIDGSSTKFKFKDVIPGVRGYERLVSPIDWLENANLLIRAKIISTNRVPLNAFSKDNIFKQYFFDVGLLGAISRLNPKEILDYEYGLYKGYMAENFVAQELKAKGESPCYCWVGKTSEVEFLLQTGDGVIPIEVKSGTVTQSKSLKVYEEKYRPSQSFVLSGKNISVNKKRRYIPIYFSGKIITEILN